MFFANEEVVTKILSKSEIINLNSEELERIKRVPMYKNISDYNLGKYLKHPEPEISKYGQKYIFVK